MSTPVQHSYTVKQGILYTTLTFYVPTDLVSEEKFKAACSYLDLYRSSCPISFWDFCPFAANYLMAQGFEICNPPRF